MPGAPPKKLQPSAGGEKAVDKEIPKIILPEGYTGKILLVQVSGPGIADTIIMRSGDLWHREILRNTEAEMRNLGLDRIQVQELGGAHLRFESDGSILIHGTSEQYGACDKEYVARLVRDAFPCRRVDVRI